MDLFSRLYFNYSKLIKTIKIYLLLAGPGLIVMIADNEAKSERRACSRGNRFDRISRLASFVIPGSSFYPLPQEELL
jgi:hypothetical protein